MPLLTLRVPEPADAEGLLAAVRESLGELYPWMDWCHPDFSRSDALRWISSQPQARETGSAFEFLIVGEQGRLLGCCGLNNINPRLRLANLGYWVRTSETGRGVATQAVTDIARWAFVHTDLERLEIVAAVANAASQAVAAKAGALREGVLRSRLHVHGQFQDAVMHSIVRPRPPTA